MSIKPQHATPSDWAWLEGNSTVDRCDAAWSRGLVELRARVEALEAAAKPAEFNYQEKLDSSNPPESSDSLVGRVADGIYCNAAFGVHEQARAAILAVADWCEQHGLHTRAARLRMEAQ